MSAVAVQSQVEFYREFLMARGSQWKPQDFGVGLEKADFIDALSDDFNGTYRGQWSVDELCLHPREAITFCDGVRRQRGWFDVPDDIILRSIMQRRKNP